MPDRVAEVEHRPQAGLFAFVPRDHLGLDPAALGNDEPQAAIIAVQNVAGDPLDGCEERRVEDDAVFDHLGHAAAELADRQSPERVGVDPDAHRLVESADDVLGAGMVDADLASDRAVDLGQERRRHHQQGESARESGGDEAGQVADHAAPQGDDERMAIGLATDQLVVKPGRAGPAIWYSRRRAESPSPARSRRRPARPGTRPAAQDPPDASPSRSRPSGRTARPRSGRGPRARTRRNRSVRRVTITISYDRGPSGTVTRFSGERRARIHRTALAENTLDLSGFVMPFTSHSRLSATLTTSADAM